MTINLASTEDVDVAVEASTAALDPMPAATILHTTTEAVQHME